MVDSQALGVGILNRDVQVQGFDLFHKIMPVVDYMSGAHPLTRIHSLLSRRSSNHYWQVQDVACQLDSSTANSAAAINLVCAIARQPKYDRLFPKQHLMEDESHVQSVFRRSHWV